MFLVSSPFSSEKAKSRSFPHSRSFCLNTRCGQKHQWCVAIFKQQPLIGVSILGFWFETVFYSIFFGCKISNLDVKVKGLSSQNLKYPCSSRCCIPLVGKVDAAWNGPRTKRLSSCTDTDLGIQCVFVSAFPLLLVLFFALILALVCFCVFIALSLSMSHYTWALCFYYFQFWFSCVPYARLQQCCVSFVIRSNLPKKAFIAFIVNWHFDQLTFSMFSKKNEMSVFIIL